MLNFPKSVFREGNRVAEWYRDALASASHAHISAAGGAGAFLFIETIET